MSNPYRLQHLRRFANGLSVGLVRASARTSGGSDPWAELFASVQRSLTGAKAAEAARLAAATADRPAAPVAPPVAVDASKPTPLRRRSAQIRPLPTALAFPRPIGTDVRAVQFFAGLPFAGPPKSGAAVADLPTRGAAASRNGATRGQAAADAPRSVDADQRAGSLFRSLAWHGAAAKKPIHIEPGTAQPGNALAEEGMGPDLPAEFAPSRVFAAGAASFLQSVPWDAVPRPVNP